MSENGEKKGGIVRSFEDLTVYQRAYALSLEIHKASLGLPRMEQYALADQIRRASKSICANLAEGFSRQRGSAPDFKRFIMMAIGSADEMKVWLDYCRDLGYLSTEKTDQWKSAYSDIAKMLHGLRESWQSKAKEN